MWGDREGGVLKGYSVCPEPEARVSDPSSPDLSRWRALVEKTLRGGSFERRMVRGLPGGLSLPALSTDRPAQPEATALVRSLARDGRWEVCAAHDVGTPAGAEAVLRDVSRGADSIWLSGSATEEALHAVLAQLTLPDTGVLLDVDLAASQRQAVLEEAARRQGADPQRLWGAVGTDPFQAHLQSGAPLPTGSFWDDATETLSARPPHLATLAVNGLAAREAGGSAVTELGTLLSSLAATLRALGDRGISVADTMAATRISVGLGRDQLVGIALLRATRLTVARLCAAFGEPDATATRSTVHGVQLRCWQTRHDPWVNLLRSTLAGFVGAVGGADAITLLPYDASGAEPSELGRRMATNTQTLLAEESHLATVQDPSAGSYAVEHLTLELARAGWAVLQAVEAAGGLDTDAGCAVVVSRVHAERAQMATDLDRRKASLVGVSDFPASADHALAAAHSSGATGVLAPIRHAAAWEDLRDAAEAADGVKPVFLATWGPLSRHSARAMFSTNLLAAGGLSTVDPGGANDIAELVAAFTDSGASAAVICGADADYPDVVGPLASALTNAGARAVWVAGRPADHEARWRAAGVTDFIYVGCDARARLADLHGTLDIHSAE